MLFVLRLVGLLLLIALGVALALYFFTRDRRYLRFAVRLLQFGLAFVLVFLALYLAERLWLVL
jgi:hypothetical protein